MAPYSLSGVQMRNGACAPTSDRVRTNTFSLAAIQHRLPLIKGIINNFPNPFGTQGFQRLGFSRTSCVEPFSFLCFFNVLKQVLSYLSCLAQCCNSVLLWSSRKVLFTTKLEIPSAGRRSLLSFNFRGNIITSLFRVSSNITFGHIRPSKLFIKNLKVMMIINNVCCALLQVAWGTLHFKDFADH